MTASRDPDTKTVISLDIGLGLAPEHQCLRGDDVRTAGRLAINQSVEEVQHMGLGRH
jgi:hypothetical protein